MAPYPYRLFLKIMNRVAINDVASPDGTRDSLNSRGFCLALEDSLSFDWCGFFATPGEMNICAVDVDSELTRQLFQRMGFCSHPGVSRCASCLVALLMSSLQVRGAVYDIVMLDVAQHRTALVAFHELAEEELRATICPGIDELTAIGEMAKHGDNYAKDEPTD